MKSKKRIIQPLQTCIYIILILLAVVYIAPMLWVLLVSLKTNAEVMGSPFSLPEIYQWGNYTFAWENARMGRAFLNSVLVSGITMIVSMLLGSMVAFAIARMRWKFFRTDTDLFFVWNDDTGSLRTDTFVCQVFQAGLDKFSDWPAASVYYILPSNSGISSDKLF